MNTPILRRFPFFCQLSGQDFTANVRVLTIEGVEWWVAMDVAKALWYADPSMMMKHVEKEDQMYFNPHIYGSSNLTESFGVNTFRVSLINESGLYCAIFGSHKPVAKEFKKWVTSEVLPAIRKSGSYTVNYFKPEESLTLGVRAAEALSYIQNSSFPVALKQAFFDLIGDGMLSLTAEKPAPQVRYVGVAQKAQEMGYTVTLSNRTGLGKFVKSLLPPQQQEERLCNGQMRPVNVYEDGEDLENAIHLYFRDEAKKSLKKALS